MATDDVLVRLGRALRARREALGISQEAFGDRIGVNRAYYGDLERGIRNVTIKNLERVAKGLGTTLGVLFTEADAGTTVAGSRRYSRKA
jgi:transcriptional regulator with XRE-family HTH domain